MENETRKSWLSELEDNFMTLARKYDLPEDMEIEIRNFVIGVAREQYKIGNKSGIRWIRQQMNKPIATGEPQLVPVGA